MSKEVLTHSESYIKKTNRIILAVGITSFVVFLFGLYLLFSSDEPIDEYEEPVFTDNDDALNVVDNTPVQESIEFSTVGDTEVPLTTTPNPVPLGQVVLGTDANVDNLENLWDNLSSNYSKILKNYDPFFSVDAPADGQGKELFHLRIGPVKTLDEGDSVCSKLGRNGVFCSVVRTQ